MIMGLSADRNTVYFLPPTFKGKRSKKLIKPTVIWFPALTPKAPATKTPDPEQAVVDEATKEEFDFAECFLKCAKEMWIFFGTLFEALGTACVASIVALPATAGLDAVIALPTCAATLITLGVYVALCAGVCGVDMLV